MLELIDEGIEAFLRAAVPLSATDVDVVFDPPDRTWSAKLSRPTINLFLWDIRRSADRGRSGVRTTTVEGRVLRQRALPMLEMRYVISAWTSDLGDERGLLAGVIRAILANECIPREYLPDEIAHLETPTLMMGRVGEEHMDVFKALDGQLKPSLNVVLTSEFDTGTTMPVGPPVSSIGTTIGPIGGAQESRRRVAGDVAAELDAIGAVVRSPSDATLVKANGQFLLRAVAGDEIVLDTVPPRTVTVPDSGGVRFA